jgi:hypothetical protein
MIAKERLPRELDAIDAERAGMRETEPARSPACSRVFDKNCSSKLARYEGNRIVFGSVDQAAMVLAIWPSDVLPGIRR